MTQREIFQFVELTADNLPEANELFSSGCGRGNEYQQYRGNPRHPFESTRLHRLQGQLDTQIGPAFAGSPCEPNRRRSAPPGLYA
jgi:hypothetical protein